ncbi:GAF domain-containing protein [Oceanicella sp. SM1341]|uniref:GAF domain-containing protein n=1 Tax=Oceanicella sp. SM1341 TaxID=1548889 RepID=UPI000E48A2FC|nr:GAF domain-containing protein [Oceanicella sp. SM1341]
MARSEPRSLLRDPRTSPQDEAGRLAALHSFRITEALAERELGRFVDIAGRALRAPIAALSFSGETEQHVFAARGPVPNGVARERSFSAHAIRGEGVFEVPDALADPRFRDSPLVTGAPGVRFYAGAPLRTAEG